MTNLHSLSFPCRQRFIRPLLTAAALLATSLSPTLTLASDSNNTADTTSEVSLSSNTAATFISGGEYYVSDLALAITHVEQGGRVVAVALTSDPQLLFASIADTGVVAAVDVPLELIDGQYAVYLLGFEASITSLAQDGVLGTIAASKPLDDYWSQSTASPPSEQQGEGETKGGEFSSGGQAGSGVLGNLIDGIVDWLNEKAADELQSIAEDVAHQLWEQGGLPCSEGLYVLSPTMNDWTQCSDIGAEGHEPGIDYCPRYEPYDFYIGQSKTVWFPICEPPAHISAGGRSVAWSFANTYTLIQRLQQCPVCTGDE